jgi:hypothetical protein
MVTSRAARITLAVLETLMGLAAVGGGLDLVLTNGWLMQMPSGLLEGSPFGSYLVPGLVLLAVGILNLASAVALLRRQRWAAPASVVVGIMWIGWFVVQVALVGLLNWQQPVYFAGGLLIVVLAAPSLIARRKMGSFRWILLPVEGWASFVGTGGVCGEDEVQAMRGVAGGDGGRLPSAPTGAALGRHRR